MLMRYGFLYLIVATRLPQSYLINQAQLLKQSQITVNRRQANRLVPAAGTMVYFLGIYIPASFTNNIKQQLSLSSYRMTDYLVVIINANASHSHNLILAVIAKTVKKGLLNSPPRGLPF